MTPERSPEEQRAGLLALQTLVPGSVMAADDTAYLAAGDRQVCYVMGGYDGWVLKEVPCMSGWLIDHVDPGPFDMSAEEAAAWLLKTKA